MDYRQEIIRHIFMIDDSTEHGARYLRLIFGYTKEFAREWQKKEDSLADPKQEIMSRIQKVRNPELLTKILTFVKCWTDDEGGIADER